MKNIKGIILAGGKGTRLYPLTLAVCKSLLPVYDKPMIYYPLSVLMMAGIRDILIISTPSDLVKIKDLLGDGGSFGINIQYTVQENPNGIAEAFILGESFIGNDCCCMILGDNIFYGAGLINYLKESVNTAKAGLCNIYGYSVSDPERFGVVELDENNNAISLEEKPANPKSNYCVTGLYFYPEDVCSKVKELNPSPRGELEITDLNNLYLKDKKIKVTTLGRGFSWFDTGTPDSLVEAAMYIKMLETHQGIQICCPEEIAFINNWISEATLTSIAHKLKSTNYGKHISNVLDNKLKR